MRCVMALALTTPLYMDKYTHTHTAVSFYLNTGIDIKD